MVSLDGLCPTPHSPCEQHACFLKLCLTPMVKAHDGLGAVMELHERFGTNLLH